MFVISNLPAPGSIAVLLFREYGEEIISFLDKGFTVYIQMKPGPMGTFGTNMQNNISKTSVLFVSISFVVLMIVSLAWLVFYYIQRFRYSHAKERLAVSSFFFFNTVVSLVKILAEAHFNSSSSCAPAKWC